MPVKAWESYPVLKPGHEIHLNPIGGTLFVHGVPVKVSPGVTAFIANCDGRHKLGETVPKTWAGDWEDLRLVGFAATAAREGWIELLPAPSETVPRVTGSKIAFFPPHMSVELTEGCNLRCDYCYRESDATKLSHMPTDALLRLLEKLWGAGLRSVELTGGEPLLHEDFRRILTLCAEKFDMVGVLTNGTRLSDDLAQQFAGMGEKLMYSVSLDASTPEVHDARRGVKGAWARTTRNVARLAALGVGIRVSMVVDERNFHDLENTLLLAKSLGARAFSYSPLLPLGRGREMFRTTWNIPANEVSAKESEIASRYKGFLGVLSEETVCEVEGEDGCGAGYRTFAMDPWGNVRPCPTFGAQELVFGNLMRQSMEEVFSHPAVFAMRQLRTPSPLFCSKCRHSDFCRYCSLRGLHASEDEPACNWRKQPAFAELARAGLGTAATAAADRRIHIQ
ncbi:MAG TPA: radical SAM protein [Alphaproteobacteria bacterium]|nr:radical SAM protein [Alphaproteobacteria bacterium]